jgi:hypothetical protein
MKGMYIYDSMWLKSENELFWVKVVEKNGFYFQFFLKESCALYVEIFYRS